mmetsp:Transcript_40782/g.93852  ORF Transcript_40782/g.93852 Transcript_40782/m.93852 type:complete len:272 (+) Transcript_40782:3991-4806(+)
MDSSTPCSHTVFSWSWGSFPWPKMAKHLSPSFSSAPSFASAGSFTAASNRASSRNWLPFSRNQTTASATSASTSTVPSVSLPALVEALVEGPMPPVVGSSSTRAPVFRAREAANQRVASPPLPGRLPGTSTMAFLPAGPNRRDPTTLTPPGRTHVRGVPCSRAAIAAALVSFADAAAAHSAAFRIDWWAQLASCAASSVCAEGKSVGSPASTRAAWPASSQYEVKSSSSNPAASVSAPKKGSCPTLPSRSCRSRRPASAPRDTLKPASDGA